jgi:hypothetical protein
VSKQIKREFQIIWCEHRAPQLQHPPTHLLWEEHLVDHHVVGVYVGLGQLLHQALRLVNGQELRNAHTHEGGEVRILDLTVHLEREREKQRQRQGRRRDEQESAEYIIIVC